MTFTKKKIFAAAACTLAFASGAWADVASLDITADVSGVCKFTTTNIAMPFGTLDPSSATPATASGPTVYRCTKGTSATSVKVNGAASGTVVTIANTADATKTLPVTLTWTVPTDVGLGFGPGTIIRMPILGTIPVASLQAAYAGSYTGSYPITIAP